MNKEELIRLTKEFRNFDAQSVYERKLQKINEFFTEEGLDACVLGLSGGVDSSLVLKLLLNASKLPESPIKHVYGCFMPITSKGTTGQHTAEVHVNELVASIRCDVFKYKRMDLSYASFTYREELCINNMEDDEWIQGQVDSITRTPALYGMAACLQAMGYASIVVGTTNRDEGSYIGFYGKASDGMVDLQPIADLHKSEVYALAEIAGVPNSIIKRAPTGDVYDAMYDEDMIGAPYWFIEAYTILLEDRMVKAGNLFDEPELTAYANNVDALHRKNQHKYMVGSPARYIDVMNRRI